MLSAMGIMSGVHFVNFMLCGCFREIVIAIGVFDVVEFNIGIR